MTRHLRRAVLGAVVAAMLAGHAQAGSVTGPNLIWFNFADNAEADQALHDYTHAAPNVDACWNSGALLLISDYPPAITNELVRRAVIERDRAAQARLRALLRKGDADLDGYDGVIVVPKGAKPRLMSFGADGKLRSHAAANRAGEPAWAEAFCAVQPPVLRKP
jgi:hypothetical protein